MFLSLMKIVPEPGKQQEVVNILLSIKGPTIAAVGCLDCSICTEHDDEHAVVYLERWRTREEMLVHIRSSLYPRILKALELSERQPEIYFYDIAGCAGFDLIEQERAALVGISQ